MDFWSVLKVAQVGIGLAIECVAKESPGKFVDSTGETNQPSVDLIRRGVIRSSGGLVVPSRLYKSRREWCLRHMSRMKNRSPWAVRLWLVLCLTLLGCVTHRPHGGDRKLEIDRLFKAWQHPDTPGAAIVVIKD